MKKGITIALIAAFAAMFVHPAGADAIGHGGEDGFVPPGDDPALAGVSSEDREHWWEALLEIFVDSGGN